MEFRLGVAYCLCLCRQGQIKGAIGQAAILFRGQSSLWGFYSCRKPKEWGGRLLYFTLTLVMAPSFLLLCFVALKQETTLVDDQNLRTVQTIR